MKIDLKNFRQSHNLFQSDMAEILQLNQSNVSRAELRGYHELTPNQKKALVERFGEEDVESFRISDDEAERIEGNVTVEASNNTNEGSGTQNNGVFATDAMSMTIIKQQSEALTKLAEKHASQNDRLIALLEKLSEKL